MVLLPCNLQHANSYLDVSSFLYQQILLDFGQQMYLDSPADGQGQSVVSKTNLCYFQPVKNIVIWTNEIIKSKLMI